MGAEYRPDWISECTLLVCAYSNTPKFRQVEADCGTIVKKEWILDCYNQKKLVDIDSYLMHAGKPWWKNVTFENQKPSSPRKSGKQIERGSHSKPTSLRTQSLEGLFSSSRVKEWAINDLKRTISWLDSQEVKPESSEIKDVAAGGIIISLQDVIDALEQNQDVRQIAEQWNVIPHAVEELIKYVDAASLSKEDTCRQAKACKQMSKRLRTDEKERGGNGNGRSKSNAIFGVAADYDSDETIEMTQEEIDLCL
uniref:BRCT domain-containing protein n=1 Tax=Manihot esculenta TaxID=3983 RepID=A0A2C9V0M4_MANES